MEKSRNGHVKKYVVKSVRTLSLLSAGDQLQLHLVAVIRGVQISIT